MDLQSPTLWQISKLFAVLIVISEFTCQYCTLFEWALQEDDLIVATQQIKWQQYVDIRDAISIELWKYK